MKMLGFATITGFILLYFFNIAFLKTTNIFDPEWLIHSWLRFLVGFLVLGTSFFYAKAITFKNAIYITLALVIADYIYDYLIAAYKFQVEIILHGIYMLIWGSVMGYCVARFMNSKKG